MTSPTGPFTTAASRQHKKAAKKRSSFPRAYDALLDTIRTCTRNTEDLNTCEPELRTAYMTFLKDLSFHLAAKNFEKLLEEKSGDRIYRSDGTINWYHEFIPIMMLLSTVRKGHRDMGVDLDDLLPHGGLEMVLITHLRHDSVEDVLEEEDLRTQQFEMLEEIRLEGYEAYTLKALPMIDKAMVNIDLMTQKHLKGPDGEFLLDEKGRPVKEDVVDYIARLIYDRNANPIAFIMKQADIVHNFATMLGASKFTPERRAKRCNEKENMYGLRQSFYDDAYDKWRPFRRVISVFDANMGETLYKNLRYLENVDLFYENSQDAFRRKPNNYPVNHRFLYKALKLDLPEIIHPLHIFLKRMQNSADPAVEPEKHARLQDFIENVIKPSLEMERHRFPYIFKPVQIAPVAAPVPVAMA